MKYDHLDELVEDLKKAHETGAELSDSQGGKHLITSMEIGSCVDGTVSLGLTFNHMPDETDDGIEDTPTADDISLVLDTIAEQGISLAAVRDGQPIELGDIPDQVAAELDGEDLG